MTTLLTILAALTAVVAGARSTWSPCGLSMLSTITPLAEQARGHRYSTTACWFVLGSLVGGASLGLVMAALAAGLGAAGLSSTTLAAFAATACLVAAMSDDQRVKFRLPVHHRQVNERWLDQFRPWVYGTGFGWQIGAGVVTYIKTSAVYLLIVLAALTGDPWVSLGIGVLFGLARGLAVFLGRRITSPIALADFHRHFMALDSNARRAIVAWDLAVALVVSFELSPWVGLLIATLICLFSAFRWILVRRQAETTPFAHRPITPSSPKRRTKAVST